MHPGNRYAWFGVLVMAVVLLTGCVNPPRAGSVSPRHAPRADDLKIKALVFRYLIDHASPAGNTNLVCFLRVSEREYSPLVERLKGSPLEVRWYLKADVRSEGIFDPATMKPGVILGVRFGKRSASEAEVYGSCSYIGDFESLLFKVRRRGQEWEIGAVEFYGAS